MDWEGNQGDITFHNSFQNYLWVTLAKQVKEFYEHNLKILKSETEEVTKDEKFSCTHWSVGPMVIKAILPNWIYKLRSAIPIKIPIQFSTDLERKIFKFIKNIQETRLLKNMNN